MMRIPEGYEQEGAKTGDFQSLPPGGYICKIIKAEEQYSQKGKQMLVLYFDITEGEYKDYFKNLYDKDNRAEKQWQGRVFQLTEGKSMPYFKGMIANIEHSNSGYQFHFDEKTLAGKFFGGIFGRAEYEKQDGTYGMSTKLFYVRTVDTIRKGVKPPEDRMLTKSKDGFYPVDSNSDDDIPF